MELRLMGNVVVDSGTTLVELPRAGERCVLATMAMNLGRRVQAGTLIEHVWDGDPPDCAEQTVASYVRSVRRVLEQAGGQREWLSNHRPRGYQLDIAPDLVDYHRFTALVAAAGDKQRAGEPAAAVAAYQQALRLRRGPALANLTSQWAQHRRYAIEQEYLDAVCALYEQQLAIGQFAAVAASAAHLITEVTPTDRMILLAAHGLAGSGQHANIADFVDRAARRMWALAEAEPSAEVRAVARRLIAHPGARLAAPVRPRGSPSAAVPNDEPARPTVIMTANYNNHVYQAGGDQHISGA